MDISTLKKRINEAAQNGIKNAATKIKSDVENAYKEVIQDFYDDYSPTKYRRGYNLYAGAESSLVVSGKSAEVKLSISADYLDDPYYDVLGSNYVFHGAFDLGFHGTSDIAVSSPSPSEAFLQWDKEFRSGDMKRIVSESVSAEMKKI